jgi:Zn-dependent alcohol dehydrogenase
MTTLRLQVIRDMTNGGVDYSFDCTGDPGVIYSALECCVEVSQKCALVEYQLQCQHSIEFRVGNTCPYMFTPSHS